ncbi:hypothetical protein L1887_22341 [Cichorium endivia]|nr:hypothetical protein L1887_22341 [Cichorium endivia]
MSIGLCTVKFVLPHHQHSIGIGPPPPPFNLLYSKLDRHDLGFLPEVPDSPLPYLDRTTGCRNCTGENDDIEVDEVIPVTVVAAVKKAVAVLKAPPVSKSSAHENLPLICIVGGPNSNDYGTNRILHHTIGLPDFSQELRCFQTVTCYQAVVNNLEDAHELIDTAISTALKESKPVYISVACNLAAIPHPTFSLEPIPFSRSPKLSNTMGLEAAVEAAAVFLNKAVKPVMVGGPKLRVANASNAFVELADASGYALAMQYGSIGWSVGATLGYAQAATDKRVIACIGDGSFQVTAQDVSTMLRWGQKSIIFLINNGGYTIEVQIHDGPYNVIKNWNYTGLVEAIHNGQGNCWTKKVFCEEDLIEAIEMATGEKKEYCLCFIEVIAHKDDTSKELLEWGSRVSAANSRPPNPH